MASTLGMEIVLASARDMTVAGFLTILLLRMLTRLLHGFSVTSTVSKSFGAGVLLLVLRYNLDEGLTEFLANESAPSCPMGFFLFWFI
jgi:hypothetical protein